MIEEVLNEGLLGFNYFYGIGIGWLGLSWLGDVSISNEEDYRFGFYSLRVRIVDVLVYSVLYYFIFKLVGND